MKKVFRSLLTVLCSVFMVGAIVIPVYAGNNTDTSWDWHMPGYSFERYTPAREKWDASPVYFKVDQAQVYGGSVLIRVFFEDGSAPSYQQSKYVKVPGVYCLSSYAYEDQGYGTRVKVRGDRQGAYEMRLSGVWSPDSQSCPW